ncbi:MAG: hypothetical protein IPL96_07775 [Holophagaceae bacterium]|nr:hypothetical protein [Holophagaceae bacterium]
MAFLLIAVAAVLVRWRWPFLAWQGHPVHAWLAWALLGLLAARVAALALAWVRGALPGTRLLLPLVLLVEGLGLALQPGPRWQMARTVTAGVLEIALLALALRAWLRRPKETGGLPEDALIPAFQAFLPPGLARMSALELVLAGGALRFLLGGWRRPEPEGFSYTKKAGLGAVLPVLPLLAIGDVVLLEVLTRHSASWLRFTLHAAGLYGFLWITGLWASMRARPHTVRDGVATFHHGLLGSLTVPLENIEGVEAMPSFKDDWAKLAFLRGVIQLQTPGPAQVLLKLKAPAAPMGLLGPGRTRDRVLIAVDEPEALRAALGL